MSKTKHLSTTERLALPAADVAKMLGISERHLWALNSSGRLPLPLRFGRAVRWNLAELQNWLDAGGPARDQWEAEKGAPP
ncbi:MAG: helix-turn-helix domain-containing protein [Planctomycetes bacterium]|nr:helix-turn-helix domain-containing protein [Planctomycetota bacterium]